MQSKRYAAGGLEPFTGVDAETPGDICQRMEKYDSLMGHKTTAMAAPIGSRSDGQLGSGAK